MAEHHSERSKHRPAGFFQSLNARLAAHESAGFVAMQDAATRLGDGDDIKRRAYHLRMCEAWASGTLAAYDGGTRLPIEVPTSEERQRLKGSEEFGPSGMRQCLDPNRQVCDLDLVKVSDLDAWLMPSGFTYSQKVLGLTSSSPAPKPLNAEQIAEGKRMLSEGCTQVAVAKHLGVSRRTVQKRCITPAIRSPWPSAK